MKRVEKMTKARIYVDETGHSDSQHSDNPNQRFFSLTGVVLDIDYARDALHPQMESLKTSYFGSHPDDPVILHRSDMINRRNAFMPLNDPDIRRQFDTELLSLIQNWEFDVITICLDKKKHSRAYHNSPLGPYHHCMRALIETYCHLLASRTITGDVMVEARGKKEDRRLKEEFRAVWDNGIEEIPAQRIQQLLTSRDLKIKPKNANVAGLQLADILANPSRSEILHARGLLNRDLAPFAKLIRGILMQKYYGQASMKRGRVFI